MSPDQLRRALRDADFPASKEELIRVAQSAGASGDVITALRAIPPVEYASREEVARSVPVDPDAEQPDVSPAQRGQQARQRRHHGGQRLSQFQRDVPKPAVEDELDR